MVYIVARKTLICASCLAHADDADLSRNRFGCRDWRGLVADDACCAAVYRGSKPDESRSANADDNIDCDFRFLGCAPMDGRILWRRNDRFDLEISRVSSANTSSSRCGITHARFWSTNPPSDKSEFHQNVCAAQECPCQNNTVSDPLSRSQLEL